MEATANMTTDEWLTCKADTDYEILKAYPHTIRRKSNGRIVAETPLPGGYLKMNLNGETTYKHRVVALQFIPNDDPVNKTQVDHINWQRDDNRVENLRWVTALQNNLNRSSSKGVEYVFVDEDELPDDIIPVTKYGDVDIEQDEIAYYYSQTTDKFYMYNGVRYREESIRENKRGGAYVNMYDAEKRDGEKRKTVKVYYLTFKKMYDLL